MQKPFRLASLAVLAVCLTVASAQNPSADNPPNSSRTPNSSLNFNAEIGGPISGPTLDDDNSYGPGTRNQPGRESITKTNSNQNLYFQSNPADTNNANYDEGVPRNR